MATIIGTPDDDFLRSTLGADVISSLGGDDIIEGSEGRDEIDGGDGVDRLQFSLQASDRFSSVPGPRFITVENDRIFDDLGKIDTRFANIEQIRFTSSGQSSTTVGQLNVDARQTSIDISIAYSIGDFIARLGGGADQVALRYGRHFVDAGSGHDTVQLFAEIVVVSGNNSQIDARLAGLNFFYDSISTLRSVESLVIVSKSVDASQSSVPITFIDSPSNELIIGSSANDVFAAVSSTSINGANDRYWGGGGADVWDFTYVLGGVGGKHIFDFDTDDRIDFRFNEQRAPAPIFIGTRAFSGVAGEYRYRTADGRTFIEVDIDGGRLPDAVVTLENGSFVLGETSAGSNILQIVSRLSDGPGIAPDQFIVAANPGVRATVQGTGQVLGATGTQDVTVLDRPGRIEFDPSFNAGGDRINLAGEASDWTARRTGSSVELSDGDTLVVVPVGLTGADIIFADGIRTLSFNQAAAEVRIGGQAIGAAVTVVTAAPGPATATGATDPGVPALVALLGPSVTVAGTVQVFGTAAAETVTVLAGARVDFDPSFNLGGDTIVLPGTAASYSAARSGSAVEFVSASASAAIPVGLAGATVRFEGGGQGVLRFDPATGTIVFGSTTIGANPGPVGVNAATIDVGAATDWNGFAL